MLTKGIKFVNFKKKINSPKIKKILQTIIDSDSQIINSLKKKYIYSFKKKQIVKYKKFSKFRVIGMGGSILGTQTIYDFLKHKIKKNFFSLIIFSQMK